MGEQIRHALVDIFADHHLLDPDLADKSITITEVKTSPDLKLATIFVVPFGMDKEIDRFVAALNRANGYFRGRLARMVHLKFTPRLNFIADRSFDRAVKIEQMFHRPEIARDLAEDEKEE